MIQNHKLLKCGKEKNWLTRRGMTHEMEYVKNCFCSDVRVCGHSVMFPATSEWDGTHMLQMSSGVSINSTNPNEHIAQCDVSDKLCSRNCNIQSCAT